MGALKLDHHTIFNPQTGKIEYSLPKIKKEKKNEDIIKGDSTK